MRREIYDLGRKIKNGNIPLLSKTVRELHYFICEPYESYWCFVDNRADKKSSGYRIYSMIEKQFKSVIYSSDWENRLNQLGVRNTQKKKLDNRIPVFIFWDQGFENAPEIITICQKSVDKFFSREKYNIIRLNRDNYSEYIDIPNSIIKLWDNFSFNHQSDIIRTMLLYTYGGIWLDATYFFVSPIPNEIIDSDFFVYKYLDLYKYNKAALSLIICQKGNELIGRTLLGLLSYCIKKRKFRFYLMINYIFSFAINANNGTIDEFNKIPFRIAQNNRMLIKKINEPFDEIEWRYICSLTCCFKMSHKAKIVDKENTFYDYIRKDVMLEI